MQNDKVNTAGTSSNSDRLKNMDEQSGKPGDGSQAYLDTDETAAESAHGKTGEKEKDHEMDKSKKADK